MFRKCISYFQFIEIGLLAVVGDIIPKECSIGFYGLYPICKECPFPSFGVQCQSICACNNDTCDHITGCMDSMLSIDCGVGYYEYLLRCKICPYPSFGTDCQSICNCQNESCNHITGCQEQIPNEGEITVGTTSAEYLFSSVACLSENSTSKNKENISDLTKSVIAVGCIGVLIICLHFILCLRENICRSSDHIIV